MWIVGAFFVILALSGILAFLRNDYATTTSLALDRAAPVELASHRRCNFDIVGESHCQNALRAIAGVDPDGVKHHCTALLRPEPDNKHDPSAVAVHIDGRHVGYLARGDAAEYTARLVELDHAGRWATCSAYINGAWLDEDDDWAPYGVKLGLVWPAEILPAES